VILVDQTMSIVDFRQSRNEIKSKNTEL